MDISLYIESIKSLGIDIYQKIASIYEDVLSTASLAISKEDSAVWATLVTDIITIASALGALALPLSLNVIETTRTRYKSPSLLKITSSLSGTDAKSLNQFLFIALAASLIAKLLMSLKLFELISLVPYLCFLTIWFCYVGRQVYRHLNFTYRLMSDIMFVHSSVIGILEKHASVFIFSSEGKSHISKIKMAAKDFFSEEIIIQDVINALVEIETYLLCTDQGKVDLDPRIKEIGYRAVHKIDDDRAHEFIRAFLSSLPPVMAAVETSREVDVYQAIAGFYLAVAMRAILSREEHQVQINVIERIARFKEEKIPMYGRYCRNGRLFHSFANIPKVSEKTYKSLAKHFSLLIDNSAREQPENIPELLDNVRSIIQFKDNYSKGAWGIPEKVNELWGYPAIIEIDKYINAACSSDIPENEFDKKINDEYLPNIIAYLEEKVTDKSIAKIKIKEVVDSFAEYRTSVALNKFSREIESDTLRVLAEILFTSPEIFIKCRELRNPAGSQAYNVGHSPVPTSLGECISSFISIVNFPVFRTFRYDTLEYKIVDAIGALIVYELWKTFVLEAKEGNIEQIPSKPEIPNFSIGEMKSAFERISSLRNSIPKVLDNTGFVGYLRVLPDQLLKLQNLGSSFCDLLSGALKDKIASQIASQSLDEGSLERFKLEFCQSVHSTIKRLDLFKRVSLGKVSPIATNITLARESFLEGTNVHHIFDTFGSNLAHRVYYHLSTQIISKNDFTISSKLAWPLHTKEWIIFSSRALEYLKGFGFSTRGHEFIWPCGKIKTRYTQFDCDSDGYYVVLPSDTLIGADYTCHENGLPVQINFTDDRENSSVHIKVEFFVEARQSSK